MNIGADHLCLHCQEAFDAGEQLLSLVGDPAGLKDLDQLDAVLDLRDQAIQRAIALAAETTVSEAAREVLERMVTQQQHLEAGLKARLEAERGAMDERRELRDSLLAVQRLLRPRTRSRFLNSMR